MLTEGWEFDEDGTVLLTLWRPKQDSTNLDPLNNAGVLKDVYASKNGCITGMVEDLRKMTMKQCAYRTRPVMPEWNRPGTKRHKLWGTDLPMLPPVPNSVPQNAFHGADLRLAKHEVKGAEDYALVRGVWEVKFYWSWTETVTKDVDGVKMTGDVKHKVYAEQDWGVYRSRYNVKRGDMDPWRSCRMEPESFEVRVRNPEMIGRMLLESAGGESAAVQK